MPKPTKKKDKMPELLTLKEACGILKCHPNTLRQWDKKGILIAVRFGERKDRRYRKDDIFKLLDRYSCELLVSLDSSKYLHDRNRCFKDGGKTYDRNGPSLYACAIKQK